MSLDLTIFAVVVEEQTRRDAVKAIEEALLYTSVDRKCGEQAANRSTTV